MHCVIDDELKVLLQQGVDQRGVRDTLSICRRHKRGTVSFVVAFLHSFQTQRLNKSKTSNKLDKNDQKLWQIPRAAH